MATQCSTQSSAGMRQHSEGYLPIENYGLIGNMRTCALVGMDGSVDYMCWYGPPFCLRPSHGQRDLCQVAALLQPVSLVCGGCH